MEKKLLLLVLLLFSFVLLPAQSDFSESVFYSDFYETTTRFDFMNFYQSMSMDDIVYFISSIFEGASLENCFQITEDNIDEEDWEMVSNLQIYITQNFDLEDRDSYDSIIIRSADDISFDGWVVFTHFSETATDKWFHYIFYFDMYFNE